MTNRAALTLMELAVMILALAICAGLCLNAFAWADTRGQEETSRQEALLVLQNAGQALKAAGGDVQKAAALYSGWQDSGFEIQVTQLPTQIALLGSARLEACKDGMVLGVLTVCWQEVGYGE